MTVFPACCVSSSLACISPALLFWPPKMCTMSLLESDCNLFFIPKETNLPETEIKATIH